MVLAGGQKAGLRAYIKTVICGLQKVYMGGLMGFPWKNRLQVGFHDRSANERAAPGGFHKREKEIERHIAFHDACQLFKCKHLNIMHFLSQQRMLSNILVILLSYKICRIVIRKHFE